MGVDVVLLLMNASAIAGIGYILARFLDDCAFFALHQLDEVDLAVASALGALGHPVRRRVLGYLC